MRYAWRRTRLEWCLLSSTKATASPAFAAETNRSSGISSKPRLPARSLANELGAFIKRPLPGDCLSPHGANVRCELECSYSQGELGGRGITVLAPAKITVVLQRAFVEFV